jgi:UDP-4-amino-4,6-dideoxy-N-acetyl-beta-L-altrosamine transaminase
MNSVGKSRSFLPYARQWIDDDDIAAVASALRNDYLTTGPLVEAFEAEFANCTGGRFAVVCNSGTAALHLAVMACGLGPGDTAIVPAMTFLATANVIRMTGADVVFADVDPDSGLMTPDTFAEALDRAHDRTIKAVIPVHINGALCAMREFATLARPLGIDIIEDACHALGVPDVGNNAHSRIACFSTHPAKAITTGEGGAAITADGDLANKMKQLRNHGMTRDNADFRNVPLAFHDGAPNPWYYEMHELGWNYRQPDILCALGLSQLRKLERFWRRRNEIARLYDQLLAFLAPVVRPTARSPKPHGWHLYAVLVDFVQLGIARAAFMKTLRQQGIGTQVHYIPVHRQPYYRDLYGLISLTGADSYYARCLSLPIFPRMTDDDVVHVVNVIKKTIAGCPT